jgi:hypothetical protein
MDGLINSFSSTWFRDPNVYDYKFSHTKIYFIDDGSAFCGHDLMKKPTLKIEEKYQFYSYGDDVNHLI